jgi:hypothetical protein
MSNTTRLDRGQQLMLLRKLQLPNIGTLHPGIIKSILRAVDGYGSTCWASIPTIATETQFSERTVYRALSILVELGYLSKDSRTGQTSSYSINWDALTPDSRSGVEDIEPLTPSQPTPDSQSVTPDSQSVTPDSQSPNTKRNVIETKKKRNTYAEKSAGSDLELQGWIEFWNSLKARNLVHSGTKSTPSKGVLAGWKRVKKTPVLRDLLSDRQAIEAAITKSEFVRGAWFRLEKLFGGTNRDGEYITQKLLDGGYVSASLTNGKPRFTSADLKTLQSNPNAGKM